VQEIDVLHKVFKVIDFSTLATIIPLNRDNMLEESVYSMGTVESSFDKSNNQVLQIPRFLNIKSESVRLVKIGKLNYLTIKPIDHDCTTLTNFERRLHELEDLHICSLDKELSFNWLVQIYHLLSIDHLESYHSGSLNGLKVEGVVEFDPSKVGGSVKFNTTSSSPFGLVRLFRGVESLVTLTMHSALTVELNIQVSANQSFTVMFNVLPLSENRHKFMIDIYGLASCKILIGQILRAASLYTISEDMAYYQALGKRNLSGIVASTNVDKPPSKMDLIHRFFEIYGTRIRGVT
jgi:hypothetical protein